MNDEKWTLSISNGNGNFRKVCTGVHTWGDGDKKTTDLIFEEKAEGRTFTSSKQAWYYWYQFRKSFPDKCQGFYAEVSLKKKESSRPSK